MTKWLDLVKNRPVAFGIESGFEDLEDIHNEWIKSFLFSEEDLTLQAHRGSYKTTCLSIAMALMIIIYPKYNIIFTRKTDDDVKEVVEQTAKLLKNDMFQTLSTELYQTPVLLIKETAFEIDTNLKATSRGASQLLGLGIKGSMTGKHGDIIITDDIININDRVSNADRKRTKLTYQELQNIKNRGGRFINTGTPWHKDDAFTLMPNIKKYDCYETGLMSDKDISDLRGKMTPSLFAANYELKHIADENRLFDAPNIDDGTNTELIYNGVCHIDAAYGGKDYSAFTILKEQENGIMYVYGSLKDKHIDDVLPEFEWRRRQFRAGTLYNETNADKGYLAERITKPVKTYHESMNKHIKISTYLKENWEKIIFIKDTDLEYINQILDYTEDAEHDDAPDSLASLIMQKGNKLQMKFFREGL
ncbi:MAG TPA: hypothetical protein GX731_04415 [Clostridiales bacterium]|nr:hypothetical protein [Clostridiales bacterium]